jgi:hypothetical protein
MLQEYVTLNMQPLSKEFQNKNYFCKEYSNSVRLIFKSIDS